MIKAMIAQPGRVHRTHAKGLVEVFLEKGSQTSVLLIGRQAARGIGKSHDTSPENEESLFHSLLILANSGTNATPCGEVGPIAWRCFSDLVTISVAADYSV